MVVENGQNVIDASECAAKSEGSLPSGRLTGVELGSWLIEASPKIQARPACEGSLIVGGSINLCGAQILPQNK